MIIRRAPDHLLFIAQPDHAALAAAIMSRWRLGGLPDHPRREAVLAATRDHDNGWIEEDDRLHLDAQGAPLDFMTVPAAVKQRIWPRATDRLARSSVYVAALVAQHALTVHAPMREHPEWRRFFEDMTRRRDALLSRASAEQATALPEDYAFIRTGDLLSLGFCNGWTAPLSGPGYRAILNGITLEITPDPFEGARVPLKVPARCLSPGPLASAAAWRRACRAAPLLFLEGQAVGA